MTALTIKISEETALRLDRLAERLDRRSDRMAADAIADFVDREECQLAEIEAGLKEAENGDFASDDDICAVVRRYASPT